MLIIQMLKKIELSLILLRKLVLMSQMKKYNIVKILKNIIPYNPNYSNKNNYPIKKLKCKFAKSCNQNNKELSNNKRC